MSDEQNTQAVSGGLSLADIAGINVSEVAEVRFEDLPAMQAIFKIVSAKWKEDVGDKHQLVCQLTAEVVQVGEFNDDKPSDEARFEKMVGKKHNESFFIDPSDIATGIGRIKAFLVDCNIAIVEGENVQVLVNRVVSEQQAFIGDIKKRVKPDSEGEFYTNLYPTRARNIPAEEGESA